MLRRLSQDKHARAFATANQYGDPDFRNRGLPSRPPPFAVKRALALRRDASSRQFLILLISILQTAVTSNSRGISGVSRVRFRKLELLFAPNDTLIAARIDSKTYGSPKYIGKLTYSAYIVFTLATGAIHLIGQRKTDAAGR